MVLRQTKFVSVTPTVDTLAYATGDLIGGKLTFNAALRGTIGTGYIESIRISDKSATAVDLDVVLFSEDPTGTTFTDQVAFDPVDTDLTKIMAVINFASADRFNFANNGVKYKKDLRIPIVGQDSAGNYIDTIYGALVSRGAPTFASASDITITLGITQN